MIPVYEASFNQLSIHKTGNRLQDEPLALSEKPTVLHNDEQRSLLLQYFLEPFTKSNDLYRLQHSTGETQLNEVFHFAQQVFNDPNCFHEVSKKLATHLYNAANHPKIKGGELYCCYFESLPVEGRMVPAIGLFKSESKEPYFTVHPNEQGYELAFEAEAINLKKLDKGCIIFNLDEAAGYTVSVIDQTNKTEAAYWTDDFLQLKIRNTAYNQTNTVLSIYKEFVQHEMNADFAMEKTDKIDLLNRSLQYFKENDHFNMDSFGYEVINNEKGIESFKNYKQQYEQNFETEISDSFSIHPQAVKKQARVFKSILKLDKNFHIYIHGNNELIEKGYDESKKMNYYKVYFREES